MTTTTHRRSIAAVPCPRCGYTYSRAVHSQRTPRGFRRRRVCVRCERGFVTYEVAARSIKETKK